MALGGAKANLLPRRGEAWAEARMGELWSVRPEDVGSVNVPEGRGSQRRVWGPRWLYFSRAPPGKEAGDTARDVCRAPCRAQGGTTGLRLGLLASAPPPSQGNQGRDWET